MQEGPLSLAEMQRRSSPEHSNSMPFAMPFIDLDQKAIF
jgi:hypothetical protein